MIADRHHRDDLLRVEIERQRPLGHDAGRHGSAGLVDALDSVDRSGSSGVGRMM